jgi:uncharacterized alpha-E superfamily protein
MILVNDNLLLDIPTHCDPGWAPVIQITGNSALFYQHYEDASERNVIRYLINDCKNNPGAMLNSIVQARENLRTCRALFPKPVWEVISNLHSYVKENHSRALNRKQRYGFLRQVIDFCHLLAGKLAVSISHDDIYEFARMGFNLERADMTSRVIDVRAQGLLQAQDDELKPFEDIQWKSVLDSLAAWQMYRRCAHIRISGLEVLRFLFQDRHFPRAIGHCLFQLEQSMYALAVNEAPRKALLETQRKVRNADMREIAGDRLHDYVDQLQFQFMAIHDELSARYFEGRDFLPESAPASLPANFGLRAQRQTLHEETDNV